MAPGGARARTTGRFCFMEELERVWSGLPGRVEALASCLSCGIDFSSVKSGREWKGVEGNGVLGWNWDLFAEF